MLLRVRALAVVAVVVGVLITLAGVPPLPALVVVAVSVALRAAALAVPEVAVRVVLVHLVLVAIRAPPAPTVIHQPA
jgi:hypothetical protein